MADIAGILAHVVENSAQLSTWALAVGGGSVLAVLSTSYHRPTQLRLRLPYLLFLPGWLCLGYSLYLGNAIVGKHMAALMVKQEHVRAIASSINDLYSDQRSYLLYALVCFAVWLVIYLLCWVFLKSFKEEKEKP